MPMFETSKPIKNKQDIEKGYKELQAAISYMLTPSFKGHENYEADKKIVNELKQILYDVKAIYSNFNNMNQGSIISSAFKNARLFITQDVVPYHPETKNLLEQFDDISKSTDSDDGNDNDNEEASKADRFADDEENQRHDRFNKIEKRYNEIRVQVGLLATFRIDEQVEDHNDDAIPEISQERQNLINQLIENLKTIKSQYHIADIEINNKIKPNCMDYNNRGKYVDQSLNELDNSFKNCEDLLEKANLAQESKTFN